MELILSLRESQSAAKETGNSTSNPRITFCDVVKKGLHLKKVLIIIENNCVVDNYKISFNYQKKRENYSINTVIPKILLGLKLQNMSMNHTQC